jgi:hypothetical protein
MPDAVLLTVVARSCARGEARKDAMTLEPCWVLRTFSRKHFKASGGRAGRLISLAVRCQGPHIDGPPCNRHCIRAGHGGHERSKPCRQPEETCGVRNCSPGSWLAAVHGSCGYACDGRQLSGTLLLRVMGFL